MTLSLRLILLVAGALVFSLLAGGSLILVGAAVWVQSEVDTTAKVARELVDQRLAEAAEEEESPERLTELLRSLELDYHLQADYRASEAAAAALPVPAARSILGRVLGVRAMVTEVPVALPGMAPGRIRLVIDPEPEVLRVWRGVEIGLAAIALVSTTTLVLVAAGLTRSLRPLGTLSDALSRVGTGDYSTRVATAGPREIALIARRFNEMADDLSRMQARARAFNAQMAAVREEERREIARDLHDELGPCLLAANLDVSAVTRLNRAGDRDGVEGCAADLQGIMSRMQDLVRHMIGRLHLDPEEGEGLAPGLDALVAFWRSRCPEIAWAARLEGPGDTVAPELATVLLRVAQEALANAVRHSGARRVAIDCIAGAESVTLTVSDDGEGIGSDAREGVGIGGMRARIQSVGGTLVIAPGDPCGTVVTAVVPLAAQADSIPLRIPA